MAHYFIGDVQGCFNGLQKALATVEFNPSKDTLWLTGDLVARGAESLATLKYLYQHQDSVRTVLGNHDLHLLAVANGLKKANPKDKLNELLNHKKLAKYLDWLRNQPLLLELPKQQGFMSHAGLAPNWQIDTAQQWNQNVCEVLRSDNYKSLLSSMYGNNPTYWHDKLSEQDKLRFTINSFTRMRFCTVDGKLELNTKSAPKHPDSNHLIPWYEFQSERFASIKWIFGHWASLMGKTNNNNIIALDTGYVWGNYLTVYKLKTGKFTYIKNTE